MRAERLIAMVFALQSNGRMTADQLAARLEVSERTVLRDVQALSAAGVPVFTTPGPGGGIQLLDGFRPAWAALTRAEAAALPVAGQPLLAEVLGLGVAAQAARGAQLRSLPAPAADAAQDLDSWFLHDPLGRAPSAARARQLRAVVRAIEARVEITLEPAPAEPLRPLGLVLEAGRWLLVHLAATADGVRPVARAMPEPAAECRLGARFERPVFDLARWWQGQRRGDSPADVSPG